MLPARAISQVLISSAEAQISANPFNVPERKGEVATRPSGIRRVPAAGSAGSINRPSFVNRLCRVFSGVIFSLSQLRKILPEHRSPQPQIPDLVFRHEIVIRLSGSLFDDLCQQQKSSPESFTSVPGSKARGVLQSIFTSSAGSYIFCGSKPALSR